MDLGLNLQSIRNLKPGEISSGSSARYEKGSAIYTGPGFRTASDLGQSTSVPALKEALVFPNLWAKSGTKIFYMKDPDSGTSYDTHVTVTTTEQGWFHEQGNGDMFYINQTDAPTRFILGSVQTAAVTSDVKINVGTAYNTKFSLGTIYALGVSLTYAPSFTAVAATDIITATAHGLSNGMTLQVTSAGTLPAGLTASTVYYVISSTTNTFKVSLTSGGAAVDITDTGSGTHSYIYTSDGYLHGISGIPAAGLSIGDVLLQTSNPSTFPSTFNGTFMFDLDSRLYVGGRLYYENILYGSAPEDAANPQFFYDFLGNGAVSKVFSGKLTGGIKGIGRAYLFTQNQCFQFTGVDPSTGGVLITPISQQYGAYNPRCVIDMEGTVAFFGKKRLIPIEITLAPSGVSAPVLNVNFDNNIRPWLASLDSDDQQGDAKLFYDKTQQILKVQARRNGVLETYGFDRGNGSFIPIEVRSAKCFSMFNGNSYFGHVSNGKVYHDDIGLTNDGLSIYHAWATGEIEADKGRKYMQGYNVQYTGYMSKGCEHTVNVYLDGSSIASYSQSFDDSLVTETIGVSLGSNLLPADGTFGGSQDIPKVFRFRNEILLIGLSGESYRIEWVTVKEGVYLKVSDYELNVYPMAQNQRTRQ